MKRHYFLYLIFGFGVLWHSIPPTRNLVLEMTPAVLMVSCILVIYPEVLKKNKYLLSWFAGVLIITFLIEVFGVSSGRIFGQYKYGSTLGFTVLNVPLVIGLNWAVIIWGCSELARYLSLNIFLKILFSSSAAVLLDLLIEPAATKFSYWHWAGNYIPLQNYAAWFIVTLIFSSIYHVLKVKAETPMPVHFYFSQLMFFGLLNLLVI